MRRPQPFLGCSILVLVFALTSAHAQTVPAPPVKPIAPKEAPALPAKPAAPKDAPATPAKPMAPKDAPATPAKPIAPKEAPALPAKPAAPVLPTAPALSAEDLERKAAGLLADGKNDEAIATFKQAIAINPKGIGAYVGLGQALARVKHYEEAATAFRSAVNLNPDNADFQFFLGSALLESHRNREARTSFERAAELNSSEARFRLAIGDTFMRDKDYTRAKEAYVRALGYAPDNPAVHDSLAGVAAEQGDNSTALDECEAALRLDPKDEEAQLAKATALSGLKRYDESVSLSRKLAADHPKSSQYLGGLAVTLDAAGKHDEAIAAYLEALKYAPDDPFLWGNLGWTQYNAGRFEDAEASSRKALLLDPSLTYVRFNLGLFFAVRGRWNEAVTEYHAALKQADTSDIKAGLHDVKEAMARPSTAKSITKALQLLTEAQKQPVPNRPDPSSMAPPLPD